LCPNSSINENTILGQISFTIFPNPASNSFTILSDNIQPNEQLLFELTNTEGMKVLSGKTLANTKISLPEIFHTDFIFCISQVNTAPE
jgi:hypothetical protein